MIIKYPFWKMTYGRGKTGVIFATPVSSYFLMGCRQKQAAAYFCKGSVSIKAGNPQKQEGLFDSYCFLGAIAGINLLAVNHFICPYPDIIFLFGFQLLNGHRVLCDFFRGCFLEAGFG